MLPKTESPAAESRRAGRNRTLFRGKLVSRDGSFSSECVIRNLSAAGARIEVPSDTLFPVRLYLIGARLPVAYDAEVVWRRGAKAGLKFNSRIELGDGESAAPLFLKRLYSELRPRESRGF
ncbi:MAG TPA: PilZ domain-containing protein [Rhizomicrobium sp.]|nr:PilZ domain-containing protein [Rhizomicrobium sp.]